MEKKKKKDQLTDLSKEHSAKPFVSTVETLKSYLTKSKMGYIYYIGFKNGQQKQWVSECECEWVQLKY